MDRDRPSRKTKSVNYCESKDFEDDDDFAFVKVPPGKKAKEIVKQRKSSQESLTSEKGRKPVDLKILERDLEAAISLSMLHSPYETTNPSSALQDSFVRTPVDENIAPSSLSVHLSNCSVDTVCLGLDHITADSNAPSKEKKEASAIKRSKQTKQDDDYQPCVMSDSESDNGYSEDEEFIVKKASRTKKEKVMNNGKAKPPPVSEKKDKQPQKSKSTVASTLTRTPLTNKNASTVSSSTSSKASKSATCLSPGTSRGPKWNPPAQIGKTPSSNSPPVKSPSQGLRLGLSRLVRVKPLHPSVASL